MKTEAAGVSPTKGHIVERELCFGIPATSIPWPYDGIRIGTPKVCVLVTNVVFEVLLDRVFSWTVLGRTTIDVLADVMSPTLMSLQG